MTKLTPKQKRVLRFIERYMAKNLLPPTYHEIAKKMGYKSSNAAYEHVKAIERKGFITIVNGTRGIRLPVQAVPLVEAQK